MSLVLKSAKRESTSQGRCVAIASLALFVYGQLQHRSGHAKIKEAIAVLLAVLKVSPFPLCVSVCVCVCVCVWLWAGVAVLAFR